jgi:hypothetical protein
MLTRRQLLRWTGTAAAAAALPRLALLSGCGSSTAQAGRFLDADQWSSVEVITDLVLPGANGLGAVVYIDRLLSAFDDSPPAIFAGGPFSGRQAEPDGQGGASSDFPPDDFATFLPLSRVQDIAWRIRLFGSTATTGGDFNDAVLGPTTGLRDLYTQGLAMLDQLAAQQQVGKRFSQLDADDQALVFASLATSQAAFVAAITEHTIEGAFSAPEYGGNVGLSGWTLARYDGDSAPLGHSQFDTTTGAYVDRADEPTSTASPGDTTETFTADVLATLELAALGSGGMRFF